MYKSKIKLKHIFYFNYYILLAELMLNNIKFLELPLKYLSYISIISLFFYIIIHRDYDKKTFLKLLLCTLLVIMVTFVSKNKQLFKLFTLLIAFKDINFDEFLSKDFKYRIFLLIVVIFSNFFGLSTNYIKYRLDGSVRYSLGFSHPNILGLHTIILCLEYIYINRNREKKRLSLFIVSIATFLFNIFITDSRICIIVSALSLLYLCIKKKQLEKIYKIIPFFIKNIYTILFIIVFILAINYSESNRLISKINELSSARLLCAKYYLKNSNIYALFGNYISRLQDLNNPMFLPLDIGYLHLLIRYGLIITVLMLYMYYKALKYLFNNKNYELISIMVLFASYSTMEANAMIGIFNPFLMLLSVFFYEVKDKAIIKEKRNL